MLANDESEFTGWAGGSRFLLSKPATYHCLLYAALNLTDLYKARP